MRGIAVDAEMVDFHDDGSVNSAEQPTFKVVTVPDSADARLFVELSSYGADLAEARHALDLAIESRGEGSHLEDVAAYLIAFAVVAYCRTYFPSNIRKPLTDHIDIPDELSEIHRLVGAFRNTTIAHSQSKLATTFPVGVVDAETLCVRDVTAATVSQTLPPPLVDRFHKLLVTADDLLYGATEQIRQRLIEHLGGSRHGDDDQAGCTATDNRCHGCRLQSTNEARALSDLTQHVLVGDFAAG